jgi:hypothetical protein
LFPDAHFFTEEDRPPESFDAVFDSVFAEAFLPDSVLDELARDPLEEVFFDA